MWGGGGVVVGGWESGGGRVVSWSRVGRDGVCRDSTEIKIVMRTRRNGSGRDGMFRIQSAALNSAACSSLLVEERRHLTASRGGECVVMSRVSK